jgi:AbiV family abortive infection protein
MTPENLLKGSFYALEQCGLLLRDASVLYRNGSYASTIVLAAFAREELGRHRMLLGMRRRVLDGTETFTADQTRDECDDHVARQRAGMSSSMMRADRDSGLGKVLRASVENPPQSPQFQKARATLKKIDLTKQKRTPSDRHEKRMLALYVEPLSETQWNRPDDTSAMAAYEFLADAVNDYSGRYHNIACAILQQNDPDLYGAIEQWVDRPELPTPEHPRYPGSEQAKSTLAQRLLNMLRSVGRMIRGLWNRFNSRLSGLLRATKI